MNAKQPRQAYTHMYGIEFFSHLPRLYYPGGDKTRARNKENTNQARAWQKANKVVKAVKLPFDRHRHKGIKAHKQDM